MNIKTIIIIVGAFYILAPIPLNAIMGYDLTFGFDRNVQMIAGGALVFLGVTQ